MSFDLERLLDLLPAVHRARDAEAGNPLRALLEVIAREVAVVEEDLAQLYDDLFVETCAEWALPYVADLLGVPPLTEVAAGVSQRAYVANTVAYRRRKGTAAVVEQLARDVSGWDAHAVEYFPLLAATQHLNHPRPENRTVNLRDWEPLERLGGAFDPLSHTADVRRVATGGGRYNLPNVGVFLWRLGAYSVTDAPAVAVPDDETHTRYTFSPLGRDLQLFTRPETEDDVAHLATSLNVPEPIGRRVLDRDLDERYYGPDKSLYLHVGGEPVPRLGQRPSEAIRICDLSDAPRGSGWSHVPTDGAIAVDPVLGRIALPTAPDGQAVRVTFHYGFGADLGGGEYERQFDVPFEGTSVRLVAQSTGDPTIASAGSIGTALAGLPDDGVVEVIDNGRYAERLVVAAGAGRRIELRAANGRRPTVVPDGALKIANGSERPALVVLDGFLIHGSIAVEGKVTMRLRHCTLVPETGPSLDIGEAATVEIDRCIVGRIVAKPGAAVAIADSIVNATGETAPAYATVPGDTAALDGSLRVERSTVVGTTRAVRLELATDAIFLGTVTVERRQIGCVRYCYLGAKSATPRRFECRSPDGDAGAAVRPVFTSLRYGDPGYGQLGRGCPDAIRRGASDGAEMGAFHDLYQPQREANLRAHVAEYLRFGMEAGIVYAS